MPRGTPAGDLAAYAGLPQSQPGQSQQQFRSGVQQYLASPFTLNSVPFTPAGKPQPGYMPQRETAPAPSASSGSASPASGQPNINAPMGSYEWWTAYNPGADYDRHFGGGGR